MKSARQIRISVPSAFKLIDLIHEMVRTTAGETEQKILLRAGIKFADLALDGETKSRRGSRAA